MTDAPPRALLWQSWPSISEGSGSDESALVSVTIPSHALRQGVLLLLLQLVCQLRQAGLVLGEDIVHVEVDIVVEPDATELRRDTLDDRMAVFVQLRLVELPLLVVPYHGV